MEGNPQYAWRKWWEGYDQRVGIDSSKESPLTIWSGCFSSWAEVLDAAMEITRANVNATGFDSHRWLSRQREMLVSARNGQTPRHTNLPLFAAGWSPETIIDFGGGSGWAYEILAGPTKCELKKFIIIEQEAITQAFCNEFPTDEKVKFFSHANSLEAQAQGLNVLFYTNSALQYLPDNSFLLELLGRLQPKMILFDDFQTAAEAEFFCLQHYYGDVIPCRLSCVEELELDLASLGYTLVGEWIYPKSFGGGLEPRVSASTGDLSCILEPRSLLFVRDLVPV